MISDVICVGNLTIIGSDNGLSPGRRQAIIWANAGILLIGPLGTNFSQILIEIYKFSFKKMHLKVSSAKWQPCCLNDHRPHDKIIWWINKVLITISSSIYYFTVDDVFHMVDILVIFPWCHAICRVYKFYLLSLIKKVSCQSKMSAWTAGVLVCQSTYAGVVCT